VPGLTPHPWDTYGPPQPRDVELGELAEPGWTCTAHKGSEQHRVPEECAQALEDEADDADDLADSLEEQVAEERSHADECRRLAAQLRPKHPARRVLPGQLSMQP
jgi:hypothetical protein